MVHRLHPRRHPSCAASRVPSEPPATRSPAILASCGQTTETTAASFRKPLEDALVTLVDLSAGLAQPRRVLFRSHPGNDDYVAVGRKFDFRRLVDPRLFEERLVENERETVSGAGKSLSHRRTIEA